MAGQISVKYSSQIDLFPKTHGNLYFLSFIAFAYLIPTVHCRCAIMKKERAFDVLIVRILFFAIGSYSPNFEHCWLFAACPKHFRAGGLNITY